MNDNKKFYNLKEVENKLHNFQEGKDYFVTPSREPEIKDYTFYNDRLKSLFGGNNWVPVRVWQEKFDGEDVRYRGHFEEGKDYRYSAQHWNYEKGYQGDRGIEDMPDWMRPVFADRQGGISEHSKVEVYGEGGKFNSGKMLKYWESKWTYQGKGSVTESLGPVEKRNPEPKAIGSGWESNEEEQHQKYLAEFQEKKHFYEMRLIEEENCKHGDYPKRGEVMASIRKSIEEFEAKIQYEKDWLTKNANYSQPQLGKDNSDLEKVNCELRHQLAQVQAELAKVLTELKKLTGKGDKKLEQQQAENEKAIKQGSVAEIKAQVQKSQALMRETDAQTKGTAPKKTEPGNDVILYLAVGSLLVAGLGGVVYWWKKHSSKK